MRPLTGQLHSRSISHGNMDRGILRTFCGRFADVSHVSHSSLRTFRAHFADVSRTFRAYRAGGYTCFTGVSRCFADILRMFRVCRTAHHTRFARVSRAFRGHNAL